MAFRKLPTKREQWRKFCERHSSLLAQLTRLEIAFGTPTRFEELLQSGQIRRGEDEIRLESLTHDEWTAFAAFVMEFSDDWQTWFVETQYPAYFREAERRGTSHLELYGLYRDSRRRV